MPSTRSTGFSEISVVFFPERRNAAVGGWQEGSAPVSESFEKPHREL